MPKHKIMKVVATATVSRYVPVPIEEGESTTTVEDSARYLALKSPGSWLLDSVDSNTVVVEIVEGHDGPR